MSHSSAPVLALPRLLLSLLLLLLLLIDASSTQTVTNGSPADIGCSVKSCVALDVALLQEYVIGLQPLNDTDQRPSELSYDELLLLPFGALGSDWKRLTLLQNSQPEGTPLRDNLLRLSRLVLAAYFHSQDVDLGENITGTISDSLNSSAVPAFEDQQANNVTLGSTNQKGSARINASFSGAYNNEAEPSSEKFAGSEGEDSTTSYYADSTSANFNQAFSTLVSLDNEASGSKSNETSPAGDNEDESTTETSWPESFSSSSSPSDSTTDLILGFASNSSSESNEAIHPRSKENFLVSRYASKETRHAEDDDLVARFFAEEHEEAVPDGENSMEDLLALMELEEVEALANESTSHQPPPPPPLPTSLGDNEDYDDYSFEFNATRSLEALLDSMERLDESTTTATSIIEHDLEPTSMQPSLAEEITEAPIIVSISQNDTSVESKELIELIDGASAEDNPMTRLAQMISGKLATETAYSNEATTENERTDRSEEYTDTTTLPSLSAATDKASIENHTRRLDDRGLVEKTRTTTDDAVPDDWASTLPVDEATSSYEAKFPHQRSRKILTIFRHDASAATGSSGNKLREAKEEPSPWPTELIASSREEAAAFNPASLKNRMYIREPGIAGMNKRERAELQLL